MEDGGTILAWMAFDASLLTYEDASPPANPATTPKCYSRVGPMKAGESDTIGDLLGQLANEAPKAVDAIWNSLLG